MKKLLALFILLGCTQVHAEPSWLNGGPDYSNNAPNMFYCADLQGTPVTTQAGLSATSPALTIYNPYGSGVNLVLLEVGADITSSPAAAAGFSLAYSTGGVTTSTSAMIVPANFANVQVSTTPTTNLGKCYRVAALSNTPVAFRYIGGTTGASAIGGVSLTDQTWGKVVIPPGMTVSFQSTSAAAVVVDFLWREDPI
jgi:hypothetical protein